MSAIAGLLHLDGRPVERAELRAMTEAMGHRGLDGTELWVQGSVGIAYCALHTTPEAATVTQPLHDHASGNCLAFDGRIDNQAALRSSGVRPRASADAAWLLAAYERWGEDAPGRLLGDFALSLWDARRRTLLCAVDYAGTKPLLYAATETTFAWASEISALLATGRIARRVDEDVVAEHLAGVSLAASGTVWAGVHRLPPGRWLAVGPEGRRTGRHWAPDPSLELPYRTDDEYAEGLRELVTEAVHCRLRSQRPILVELSGGIDSSSIVGTTMQLHLREGVPPSPPETLSIALVGTASDETSYFRAVTDHWGLTGHRREPPPSTLQVVQAHAARFLDIPGGPLDALTEPLKELVPALGSRVVLSGSGADDLLTGSFHHNADLLRRLRFMALARRLHDDASTPSVLAPRRRLLHHAIAPLVPLPARRWLRGFRRSDRLPAWMSQGWRPAQDLVERLRCHERDGGGYRSCAQRDIHRALVDGLGDIRSERRHAWYGHEQRHPFMDRRIVEFGLALPEDQRWRGREVKGILRRAMAPVLPEAVMARRGTALYLEPLTSSLDRGVTELFEDLECERRGWVDGGIARDQLRRAVQARGAGELRVPGIWQLWNLVGVEAWFRACRDANLTV